jgi:hypothetical protein
MSANAITVYFLADQFVAEYHPHCELAGRMMTAQSRRQTGLFPEDTTFGLVAEQIAEFSAEFKSYWDNYLVGVEP